ncbi:MFS transporter [Sorangium sp. So ce834]|uniref:MFS transporter n=1 Tax=Sorangium sp. So ce834 TaxID=3133321 RepID=UPI003F62A52A
MTILPASPTAAPRSNRAVIGVALAGFSAFLDLYATQAILPLLARTFHCSALEASATVSATTTAVALAAPLIGPFADMIGRKRVIVAAVFALSLPTFLAATASGLKGLIVFRFLQGLFMPAIFAVTIAYVSEEWAGMGAGRAMAGYVTGNIAGGVTGRFLSGLIAARLGWTWSFVVLGSLNLVAGVALWALLPPSRRFVRETSMRTSLRAMLAHLITPRLWAAYAVGFNVLFSIVATFTYVNFYLSRPPFQLGTVALGSIFFVYLGGIVVTPIGGRWLDRRGARPVLVVALAVASCGVLLTLVPALWAVLTGLTVCASAIFVCQSAANSYVGAAAGRARSSAAGLYVSFYYLGGTTGATIPGLFWRIAGWPGCVAVIVGVQLWTAALVLAFWRRPGTEHGVTAATS